MESAVTSDKWRLTLHGTPTSTLKPSSVDLRFSLKNSQRLHCQRFFDVVKEYPQKNSTLSNQVSRFVIEDPILLEAAISKDLVHLGVNTSLWPDIIRPILCFVEELLDEYGAASALTVDLELLVENNTMGEDESTCAICLDELRARVGLIKTPCDHVFHDSCLTSWLRFNNSCPLCRRQVSIDDDDDDYNIVEIIGDLLHNFLTEIVQIHDRLVD